MGQFFRLFPIVGISTDVLVHDMHKATFGDAAFSGDSWCGFQAAHDWFLRLFSVDLSDFGLKQPLPFSKETGAHRSSPRIPVFDCDDEPTRDSSLFVRRRPGAIDLIKQGAVVVLRGRLERLTSSGVVLGGPLYGEKDGTEVVAPQGLAAVTESHLDLPALKPLVAQTCKDLDAVIFATGFRHRLDEILVDHEQLLAPTTNCEGNEDKNSHFAANRTQQSMPLVNGRCRSSVIDSIYFVGFDSLCATLSLGPVLGFRGYDVGVDIAHELYGTPKPSPFPSIPSSEQGPFTVEKQALPRVRHAASVLAIGVTIGMVFSFFRGRKAVMRPSHRHKG